MTLYHLKGSYIHIKYQIKRLHVQICAKTKLGFSSYAFVGTDICFFTLVPLQKAKQFVLKVQIICTKFIGLLAEGMAHQYYSMHFYIRLVESQSGIYTNGCVLIALDGYFSFLIINVP